MEGTKECRTLSCSNYCFLLNHEILLESHDYFLFTCLPLHTHCVCGACVILTNTLVMYCVQLYIQFSKFFRRLSYKYFGTHRHAEVHEVNEGGSTPRLLRSTSGASKANAGAMVGTV